MCWAGGLAVMPAVWEAWQSPVTEGSVEELGAPPLIGETMGEHPRRNVGRPGGRPVAAGLSGRARVRPVRGWKELEEPAVSAAGIICLRAEGTLALRDRHEREFARAPPLGRPVDGGERVALHDRAGGSRRDPDGWWRRLRTGG